MSNLLNAMKEKFKYLKQNVMLRTVLISVLALLLIFSVTFAWYINNMGMWGMEFNTGNIDFKVYLYSENGTKIAGPIAPDDEDLSQYLNAPLAIIDNAQVGSLGTVYIAIESCGSIGIDYRIAFDITGKSDKATAYLGGYKYNIGKVTDKVAFNGSGNINVSKCERPERIVDEVVTIDRNAVNGTIAQKNGYDIYRFDYTLVNKNEEYTGGSIKILMNVFATQVGGDFEETEERGFTYYCSSREDIDRAKVEAYPGDVIKLTSDIVYYGDLVFNKPINLETNDFTLTVNGNLMYDYVLGNSLKLDAGGLGRVVVQCTKEGVGGNFKIKAPLSEVSLIGSNASIGDFVVEKTISVDATNSFGSPGISFNNVRIVDEKNSRKSILLDSNTRVTVSFGTTLGLLQSDVKANNIEIINNGVIGDINLSSMEELEQTNYPQIYILNNNDINNPISLPSWSVKFVDDGKGNCTGNTKIIQSYSGSQMTVVGNCAFKNRDIVVEMKDALVEQIEEGNDSRLKIYYQDIDGNVTSIKSILENYLKKEATTGCSMNEILQLEIISIGTKAITNADIAFMNSDSMLSLKYLDMHRANIADTSRAPAVNHKLHDNAFAGVSKYENLILPQNLIEIGAYALAETRIDNYITIPSGVTTYGRNWFIRSQYVAFASSIPDTNATSGMSDVKAIFVDEPYIASYKSVFDGYLTRIYPISVLDETKEHFVRNIGKDEWEITYLIRGEDPIIGDDITIDGEILKITSVYDNAYRHNFIDSSVVFDDTVLNVGSGNFYGNKNITSADLNNVKTLGDEVFYNCTILNSVDFGEQLETIGSSAFARCSSLKLEVQLPVTMKRLGVAAFEACPITKVHTGGATIVGARAFSACEYLISAELPDVTTLEGGEVFAYCPTLVSVSIPSATTVTGNRMFAICSSLRELHMGAKDDGVSLGTNAFVSCNFNLIKLFVPEENLSFYQEKRPGDIEAFSIYPSGEKMGENLVNGFNIGEYIVKNNGDNTYTLVTSNLTHTGKYTVPTTFNSNPITKIYANCFRNQSFTGVNLTIGNNIKSIGDYAFYALNGLSEVTFGNALEHIGQYAFSYCSNITHDIVLPNSMKTIANCAFQNSAITGVKGGGTSTAAAGVFSNCGSLVYAQLPELVEVTGGGLFEGNANLVSVDVPKLAKVAGNRMFAHCASLVELYMGVMSGSASLGDNPFPGANGANIKLYVPESAVSFYYGQGIVSDKQVYPRGEKVGTRAVHGFVIGDYVVLENSDGYTLVTSNLYFNGNMAVIEEYQGKPITEIYTNAFRNQSFTNVNLTLGDQVKRIGNRAFYELNGLKTIKMDGVTTVGEEAFCRTGLQILNGPQIVDIGGSAFADCASLETVNLAVIVHLKSAYVFGNCANLKSIYFEDMMSINETVLNGCNKLQMLTINRQIDAAGTNLPIETKIPDVSPCKIYVPYASLSAYKTHWSGKHVVSFDIAVKHNDDTYILSEGVSGRYTLIDFIPAKSADSLTLPSSFTYNGTNIALFGIQNNAFSTVNATLKNITLSSSVAMLDTNAFGECGLLENIYVSADNRYFTAINGVLYSKDSKMLVKYPAGRSGKFDMTASAYSSTVGIGSYAFGNAEKLTEIIFPAALKVIDSTAFSNCSDLSTVEFTGTTPPVLMGSGIFDTDVDGFEMIIPTTSSSVVGAYLCAYNFGEYEPYINLGGYSAPGSTTNHNKVNLG